MILNRYRTVCCFFVALVFLMSGMALAEGGSLRANPASFHFGHIPEGVKVYGSYWLANAGKDTIHIQQVKPQCGCTAAPLVDAVIVPGDSVALDFSFNSSKMHGLVNKRINVWYDDTTASPTALYFTANVSDTTGAIVAQPGRAEFDDLDKVKEDITLTNISDGKYSVVIATPPPPYIQYNLSQPAIGPGEDAVLTLQLTDSVPLGLFQASLTIHLEGRIPQDITIPIGGTGYVR